MVSFSHNQVVGTPVPPPATRLPRSGPNGLEKLWTGTFRSKRSCQLPYGHQPLDVEEKVALVDWNSDLILEHSKGSVLVPEGGFHVASGVLQAPGSASHERSLLSPPYLDALFLGSAGCRTLR